MLLGVQFNSKAWQFLCEYLQDDAQCRYYVSVFLFIELNILLLEGLIYLLEVDCYCLMCET